MQAKSKGKQASKRRKGQSKQAAKQAAAKQAQSQNAKRKAAAKQKPQHLGHIMVTARRARQGMA
ncbi:hypothetical protein GBA52_024585 [Prunus armeniaca]|nr:hypothetical protein GBA52_024585 [Prunus armeniaca]